MMTDTEIRHLGLRALVDALGTVEAERFVSLIQREPFDYTAWQQQLWTERSVDDISAAARRRRKSPQQASGTQLP